MSIERRFSDLQVEVNGLILCAGKKIHDILESICTGMPADV